MVLLFDNYDSFTYNLLDLLKQFRVEVRVVRNDELTLSEIINLKPSAILISPGPGQPKQSGSLMPLLEHFYDKVPILGVCLGMQAIGEFFGAKLVRAKQAMHGKTSELKLNDHPMFAKVPQNSKMMRYHSLILENLPMNLEITAKTLTGEVMAIAHTNYPIWAVQFHPESILSTDGPQIIENWISHFQLFKDFSIIS